MPNSKLISLIKILRRFKATLLAQNIDSFARLQTCKKLGFKLFHGPFISKPANVNNNKISTKSAALLQLAQALQNPDVTPQEIEDLILMDPILSFKILRVINSAAYNLANKIDSLQQAIVMLGLEQIRIWTMIIMLSDQEGKPEEWSRSLIARARICELLAELCKEAKPETAFMVGMVSQLDVLLEVNIERILEEIPLEEEVKQAILKKTGPWEIFCKQSSALKMGTGPL
ncbi:MAG: HDOD domain-containing protein [Amphritea sp.]